MSTALFREWLKDDNRDPVILCELDFAYQTVDVGVGIGTIYLADHPYRTERSDAPSNKQYRDVIASVPNFSRSIDKATLGGRARQSVGTLELNNQDGSLDFMLGAMLDGREARFYLGDASWPRANFVLAFVALVETVAAPAQDRLSVRLRNRDLLLNTSFLGYPVGGSGPNANLPQPIVYGLASQLEPILEDLATLKYRLHGPPLVSGGSPSVGFPIFDNGLALNNTAFLTATSATLTANAGTDTLTYVAHGLIDEDVITFNQSIFGSIVLGTQYWVRNRTANTFQLSLTRTGAILDITSAAAFGGSVIIANLGAYTNLDGTFYLAHSTTGRITASFGNSSGVWAGYPSKASDVAYYVAVEQGGLPQNKFGGYHWSLLPYDALDFSVQLVVKDRTNVADVLDQLMFASNGFWGFDRRSNLVFGRIYPENPGKQGFYLFSPDPIPILAPNSPYIVTEDDVQDLKIDHLLPQYKSVGLWHRINQTVLDTVAGAVDLETAAVRRARGFYYRQTLPADSDYLTTPWRWHPTMIESPDFETLVSSLNDVDAQTVAANWAPERRGMFLPHVEIVELDTTLEMLEAELGDIMILKYPRFGFTGGVTLQIIGIDIALSSNSMRIQAVWRRLPDYLTGNYDA